ncbi:MAG TPA: hypothetical protein PKB14_23020 [Rubrivivax sp.]|nr:hypothetical protein [Rubrivivax sp.]
MAVKLNHTIIHSKDPVAAADFYSAVFALPPPVRFGPFLDVEAANDVTLAFLPAGDMEVQTQHYAEESNRATSVRRAATAWHMQIGAEPRVVSRNPETKTPNQ